MTDKLVEKCAEEMHKWSEGGANWVDMHEGEKKRWLEYAKLAIPIIQADTQREIGEWGDEWCSNRKHGEEWEIGRRKYLCSECRQTFKSGTWRK